MVSSSIINYSELLDLFISYERRHSHTISNENIISKKIGISLLIYDRLKRGYIPKYTSKISIILRKYLETNMQHTFVHQKGNLLISELPSVPKSGREKRMETRINHLVSQVKILEIENNYLRNRLKEEN